MDMIMIDQNGIQIRTIKCNLNQVIYITNFDRKETIIFGVNNLTKYILSNGLLRKSIFSVGFQTEILYIILTKENILLGLEDFFFHANSQFL